MPLVYAVAGEESGRLVRDYKDHPLRAVRERAATALGAVVAASLARHSACIEAAVGSPVTVRTTVPPLTFRAGSIRSRVCFGTSACLRTRCCAPMRRPRAIGW